jgi:hypothetical protein
MRVGLAGLVVALACGRADAQAPSANAIAAVEVAIHCNAVMERADSALSMNLFSATDMSPYTTELDAMEARFTVHLPELQASAGYDEATMTARKTAAEARIASYMFGSSITAGVRNCLNGPTNPQVNTDRLPEGARAFAMGGRNAKDVMFVDTKSLLRLGHTVRGWQLYVFSGEQQIGGKPARAQWSPFVVDCLTPAILTYGGVGLSEAKTGAAVSADARRAGKVEELKPNTFGAAAWMIACEVTKPAATFETVEAVAAHAAKVFATAP